MNRILNFLYLIKEKPCATLGEKSLNRLCFTLAGYIVGIYDCERVIHSEFRVAFQKFIEEKYNNDNRTEHSWEYFILKYSKNDEEAFDNFYKLLDEFLVNNNQIPFSDSRAKKIYVFPHKTGDDSMS